jgi:DNA helicase II / ATP-dependent DNA helicase PcrA
MGHDIDGFDRDKLIGDFLSDFSNTDKIDKMPAKPKDDTLEALTIEDYDPVETSDETDDKIKELQKLTRQIENNTSIDYESHYNKEIKEYKINYRKELNPNQYYAVSSIDKPLLVIAGAGSGKTRTIVYRVGYLLENDVDPAQILLLTFTRKAASEMINRTVQLLGNNQAERIIGGTFHSFANYTIRKYANLIGVQPQFSIIDTIDSQDIIALIRDELIKKRDRAFPKKKRLQEIISKAKNCVISIEEVIEREFSGLIDFQKEIELIADTYEQYKKANYLLDYDDLLVVMANALKSNPRFKELLQRTFRYVMVDEYQDTNIYQKEIVVAIAEKHRRIMVVGDDSQSIYSFRGANFENILQFPAAFPDGSVVKIEQNYRSNQKILDFTNSIISNAKLGYRKVLFSENLANTQPVFKKFYDQESEAEFIVDRILELREQNIPLYEMAILVRAAFHGNYVQAELLKRNIPYVVVGGIKFTERRHIRDMISFLRIIVNPYDAAAWHRILKLLPGIGEVSARSIIKLIRANDGNLQVDQFKTKRYFDVLEQLQMAILRASEPDVSVTAQIEILRAYYVPILKLIEDDFESRNLDIDVLHSLSGQYDDLGKFLSDFALDPPSNQFQDSATPLITEDEEKPVTISTIHSAKGLEWHTVFIPHLIDGLFPSSRALKSVADMEEERRLFYVASTRAKEKLYLSMPSYFSSWDKIFTKPSRFLVEIDKKFLEILY